MDAITVDGSGNSLSSSSRSFSLCSVPPGGRSRESVPRHNSSEDLTYEASCCRQNPSDDLKFQDARFTNGNELVARGKNTIFKCNPIEPMEAVDTLNKEQFCRGQLCANIAGSNGIPFNGRADVMEFETQDETKRIDSCNNSQEISKRLLFAPTPHAAEELSNKPYHCCKAQLDCVASSPYEATSADGLLEALDSGQEPKRFVISDEGTRHDAAYIHSGNGPKLTELEGQCESSMMTHLVNARASQSNEDLISDASPSTEGESSFRPYSVPSDFSPSTGVPTGYNRSKTTPARHTQDLDAEILENSLLRSKTEKGVVHRHVDGSNLLISAAEKLSERKKKKLIENLVTIQNDGSVEVDIDRSTKIAPNLFDLDVSHQTDDKLEEEEISDVKPIPPLNIAMLIVGTRGDVQPFIAIGKRLQERGHRVRLATHANFREFVTCNGLEFYPLGGDPKVLAGYMVKNKGFFPSGPAEISTQKKQLKAIMNSLLPACTESDGDLGLPFRAHAILANPPAYGNVHVAEYLGVPLHIFFTMPWTPTNEFPHPLARVKKPAGYRLSYLIVDSLMWWGMRGLINEFRMKKLKLHPIMYFNMSEGSISHFPTGYIWSPHLVPKPKDWGPRVDVVGFCFLNLATDYRPPDALTDWLQAGEKPIYVGFGSLPVEDPRRMTEIIVQALGETNQRGIIDKGWGGLGNLSEAPEFLFCLENCPHDWLFPQCAAVVHHGGAGTTAAGLKAGCPTTIVPFFGDQPFWGERVHAKGVGPPPIPVNQFSLERLVNAIKFMLDPEVKQKALELAKNMEEEDGVTGAVDAFYRHWPKCMPQPSPSYEPPSCFDFILFYLRKLSCLSCFS